ncbi:MAG: hypothetical protein AAGD38_17685, partial [Acidobacteriota bacterium]
MSRQRDSDAEPRDDGSEDAKNDSFARLLGRFPAFERLVIQSKAREIPYIQQTAASDCGAACHAMGVAPHRKRQRMV